MPHKQSPTPSMKQRNRACPTLLTPVSPSPHPRLNQKGVNVSTSGISVKTGKHMTREAYLDATQRSVLLRAPFPPSPDHQPSTAVSSRRYRRAPQPFQIQASQPSQMEVNANIDLPQSPGVRPVEVTAASAAPKRSPACLVSARARASTRTAAHEVALIPISNVVVVAHLLHTLHSGSRLT
jgi:hypothetical protein